MRCPNGCSTTSASGQSSPIGQPHLRAARSSGSPPTASTRHTFSSVGRRRRWTRLLASSTSARATRRCARLVASALEDADCPLFVISTVRSDFLDRFAEDLPRLVAVRNRAGRPWTLAPIGDDSLREVLSGPARLAGLDV